MYRRRCGSNLFCRYTISNERCLFFNKRDKNWNGSRCGTFPRIVKLLPEGIVKELAFTGRNFSAQEAKDYGFVNRLYDSHEALIEGALEIAKEIASNSPAAVFGCKKA